MSVICLQYGQCGSQVGEALYSLASEDINSDDLDKSYNLEALNTWFSVTKTNKWRPHSILIDTENKVTDRNEKKSHCFKHIVAKACGGSANNWAFGYSSRSKLLQNDVLECVRTEVESCDFVSHILNIFSSSGGTGSGVGSKIIEELRDIYPNKTITNAVVLPYFKGEVVTQNYNTVLSLSKLYTVADSTIIFENDKLHYVCRNNLNVKDISFSCLNNIIAQQLLTLYQPLTETCSVDMLHELSAHPSYKYLQIKNTPHILKEHLKYESPRNWRSLVESLSKQFRYEFTQQATTGIKIKSKCVSNAIISRGVTKPSEFDIKPFTDPKSYVTWLPKSLCCKSYHYSRKFNNIDNYLTVVSNNNNVYVPLNLIVQDAWNLFTYVALGWSIEDKRQLMVALKRHGINDLELIQRMLPYKSISEIRSVIEMYSKRARGKRLLKRAMVEDCALNGWIRVLQSSKITEVGLSNSIPRMLKYIALFEKREESDVNLRDCYLALADMCQGNIPKKMDEKTTFFFHLCLTKLAEYTQREDIAEDKAYVKKIDPTVIDAPLVKTYSSRKQLSKGVNPLKFPEEKLKINNS